MLLLLIIVLILVFGGGGFWGYRSGRLGPDASLSLVVVLIVVLVIILGGLGPHYGWYRYEAPPMSTR